MTDLQTPSGSAAAGGLPSDGRPPVSPRPDDARNRYAAVWRWHFYAGLYTAPFLVVLALTGLMMLFGDELERWQFPELTRTEGASDVVPHQNRLESALAGKATFVSLLGLEGAQDKARKLVRNAEAALETYGETAGNLRQLARFVIERDA